jgi:hypothetical protein
LAIERSSAQQSQDRAPWWALLLMFLTGLAPLAAAAALCAFTSGSWVRLAGLDPGGLELGAVVIQVANPLLALVVGTGIWATQWRWTKRAHSARRMRLLAVAVLVDRVLGNTLNAYAAFFGGLLSDSLTDRDRLLPSGFRQALSWKMPGSREHSTARYVRGNDAPLAGISAAVRSCCVAFAGDAAVRSGRVEGDYNRPRPCAMAAPGASGFHGLAVQ